jgi:hypothetical protein
MAPSGRLARRLAIAAGLACLGALATACGSSGPAPAPTVTVTKSPSSSPAASASTPAPAATSSSAASSACATSALHVSLGQGGGAAGSTFYPIVFTNISGSGCTLFGYPGVSFVTKAGGTLIGKAAKRNPTFASQLVTIAPGGTAHAQLQVVNAMNFPATECGLVTAHVLRVFPPGQFTAFYIPLTAPACSAKSNAVRILAVQTTQPGSGGQ